MKEYQKCAREMLGFIEKSPSSFHAVKNIRELLEEQGFAELDEREAWKPKAGGGYYVIRNGSSLIAFRLPGGSTAKGAAAGGVRGGKGTAGFHIAAAHSDSPSFKVKEAPEAAVENHYVRLNTEKYGGMILSTWLDRPLSVAGRVAVRENSGIVTKLVNIDRDLLVIPNVAIHMNRDMNNGFAYNPQTDMLPLYADCAGGRRKMR